MTIYNQDGLRAELVDGEAIAIYIEDVFHCELPLSEWFAINRAIPSQETVKFDVFG